MKKLFMSVILILIVFIVFAEEVKSKEDVQMIPDEAIRLRILANSDEEADQDIKRLVRDEVSAYISERVETIDDIELGREVIEASIPQLERIVAETLMRENVADDFTIEFARNISFPLKVYDDFVYPAGEYEAILITIGAGEGANWWCVLFPPLCFVDFANGSTVEEVEEAEVEEVEVKFFLFEWLDALLS